MSSMGIINATCSFVIKYIESKSLSDNYDDDYNEKCKLFQKIYEWRRKETEHRKTKYPLKKKQERLINYSTEILNNKNILLKTTDFLKKEKSRIGEAKKEYFDKPEDMNYLYNLKRPPLTKWWEDFDFGKTTVKKRRF